MQRLQTYCSEDLGGFYLDVLKDRLYTAARDSAARRSAQTALALIRDALLKLMAPILSFTAEEAWRILRPDDPTIFVHTWDEHVPPIADADALTAQVGAHPRRARARAEGARGGAPGGRDRLVAAGGGRRSCADVDDYAALASLGDDLRFVLITSAARVTPRRRAYDRRRAEPHAEMRALLALARRRRRAIARIPALCGRCVANLFGAGEPRRYRVSAGATATGSRRRAAMTRRSCARASAANLRWLWLSLAVIVVDQATKHWILASFRPGEDLPLTSFASLVLAFNHRRGVQLPRRRGRLAALALRGDRRRRLRRDGLAAAARRQGAVLRRARADHRRRARQSRTTA